VLLASCAGPRPRDDQPERPKPFHPAIELLQPYDTNKDGILTRAELEAGLKADFAAADTNHDGRLDEEETRAVNEQRWSQNASTTSTLVDWNHDGYVDFAEFAATARSLFVQLDRNGDGQLEPEDWQLPKPKNPTGGEGDEAPAPKP
jgi:Ca2+-binding EF-hand superfamily protein